MEKRLLREIAHLYHTYDNLSMHQTNAEVFVNTYKIDYEPFNPSDAGDPSKMIIGEFGKDHSPSTNVAAWIKANTARYIGEYTPDKGMKITKVDNGSNINGYKVGSNFIDPKKVDLFVKLPTFWYTGTADTFSLSRIPQEGWQKWDGDTLVSAFKCSSKDDKLVSIPGVTHSSNISLDDMKAITRAMSNEEDHFSMGTHEFYNVIALLFVAYYGTTDNRAVLGFPVSVTVTGQQIMGGTIPYNMLDSKADPLGDVNNFPGVYWGSNMRDGKVIYTNFFGFEQLGYLGFEYIDNLITADTAGLINVLNWEGEVVRTVQTYAAGAQFYATKLVMGPYCDILPAPDAVAGAYNKYFCSSLRINKKANLIPYAYQGDNGIPGGIFCRGAEDNGTWKSVYDTCRLQYVGRIYEN